MEQLDINKKLQDKVNSTIDKLMESLKSKIPNMDMVTLESSGIVDELKKVIGVTYIKGFRLGVRCIGNSIDVILNQLDHKEKDKDK